MVVYYGDKTTRYSYRAKKLYRLLCTAFRKRCESKDAVLRGSPLGCEPFIFTASVDGKLRLSELSENWRKEIGAYLTLRNFSSRA